MDKNWFKSSYSENNGCVEMADHDDTIGVRDSKNCRGGMLRFTPRGLTVFLAEVKSGKLDELAR